MLVVDDDRVDTWDPTPKPSIKSDMTLPLGAIA